MTSKYYGIILIMISFIAAGQIYARSLKIKINYSKDYLQLLEHMSENIKLYHVSLSEIYSTFHSNYLSQTLFFEDLKDTGLYEAYLNFNDNFIFDKSHISFCERIGNLPLNETLVLLENEKSKLQKDFEGKIVAFENKCKLYPALFILFGLGIAILIV